MNDESRQDALDTSGRLVHDMVTAFGTDIDDTVKRLTNAYLDPSSSLVEFRD